MLLARNKVSALQCRIKFCFLIGPLEVVHKLSHRSLTWSETNLAVLSDSTLQERLQTAKDELDKLVGPNQVCCLAGTIHTLLPAGLPSLAAGVLGLS